MKDPYSRILEHMQVQGMKYNPSSIEIGTVITSDPLTVKIGDLQVDKDNLLIADYLLKDYTREIKIPTTNASGTAGDQNISNIAIPDGILNFTNGLKSDDVVITLGTDDKQSYIILARVVSL